MHVSVNQTAKPVRQSRKAERRAATTELILDAAEALFADHGLYGVKTDLFWGYHFVTGALMLTLARTGRIEKLSSGLNRSDDFAAIKSRMARFMAAGLTAICESRERG